MIRIRVKFKVHELDVHCRFQVYSKNMVLLTANGRPALKISNSTPIEAKMVLFL